jgi:hypothetical protein
VPDGYTIIGQEQTHEIGADGKLLDVMEVTFQTEPEEFVGHVRVPLKSGWVTTARALIDARVAELRELAGE